MRRGALATLTVFTAAWVWFSVMAVLSAPAADSAAMTVGCDEATCCTSRCYLDQHGKHHCVPKEGESCECGLSAPERDLGALPVLQAVTLNSTDMLHVDESPTGRICSFPVFLHCTDLRIPTPPPRFSLSA